MRYYIKCAAGVLSFMMAAAALPASFRNVTAASEAVFINEICTQNKSCLADSYGSYSDWIELYNQSDAEIDISGYGLSDKADYPQQWVFPAGTTIAPKGYLIVFASKQTSTANEMHIGFSLSKNGETLILSNPQGEAIQTVTTPTLAEDATYGRTQYNTFETMQATPGTVNAVVISAPTFSADSGFYQRVFALTLSSANQDMIYYTTDGSDPTTSSTAQQYTGAITVQDRTNQPNLYSNYAEDEQSAQSISRGTGYQKPPFSVDKTTVVRAAAKSRDGVFSDVVDRTYFITNGKLSKYQDMMVVSLVTNPDNLFDPDIGIYVTGTQYLNWRNSGAYNPQKSVWDTDNITNFFLKGREWEREASITIFENGTPVVAQNMGIRIKGASTRNTSQKSFNLYARSDYGASKIEYPLLPDNLDTEGNLIDKYDTISLRSVSTEERLRDGFAQGMLADRNALTTQNMRPCVLFLDGEYWGLYMMTEKFSDYFIETNYGIQKQDVAMIKNGELEEGPQSEYDRFFAFAKEYAQKDMTDSANYKAVCDYIDVDSLIEHYAAGLYLGTYDWPNYNYGIWRNMGEAIAGNSYSDGKWRFITLDLDYSMGATYQDFGGVEGYAYDSFRHMNIKHQPTALFCNLLNNTTFREQFAAVYCDYANEVMTANKASDRVSYYRQNYTELIADSLVRWWGFYGGSVDSNLEYNRNDYWKKLDKIQTFFSQRAGYTLDDMKEFLRLSGNLQSVTLKTNGNGRIQINSITPDCTNGWTGKYYSDCNVTVTAIPDAGASFAGWEGDYAGNEKTVTMKLSKAMRLQANFADRPAIGDVNADGRVNIADAVLLQKYLLTMPDAKLTDWKAADLDENGILNTTDLVLLKRELLSGS